MFRRDRVGPTRRIYRAHSSPNVMLRAAQEAHYFCALADDGNALTASRLQYGFDNFRCRGARSEGNVNARTGYSTVLYSY
ncbi:hypothetical protein EVAR_54002_1 [Eumeta japonica]|uniref:Uncharacterized protein n=1 Tax=Eumeta variegata TaxID=151549 RepID=A0A4C1YV06_EUMVA|nr:hypothetical protein EVAR_54002_1 [Eumeta japonica]